MMRHGHDGAGRICGPLDEFRDYANKSMNQPGILDPLDESPALDYGASIKSQLYAAGGLGRGF